MSSNMLPKIIVLQGRKFRYHLVFNGKNITVEPDTNNHLLNTGTAYKESRAWIKSQYINEAIMISAGFY